MVTDNIPPRRPVLTLDDLARPMTRRPERLYALTAAELSIAFSQALDLAEGKSMGHAQRVCYIATTLADALEADPAVRTAAYFGALFHDAGTTLAGAELCRVAGVDEEKIFGPLPVRMPEQTEIAFADRYAVVDAIHQHCELGAKTVQSLELPQEVAEAVAAHHEWWDGSGFPVGLQGDQIPLASRLIAIADTADVLIGEQRSSLAARRNFVGGIGQYAGRQFDPDLVARLLDVAKSDDFWLGLYSDSLPDDLATMTPPIETRRSRKRLMRFAEVFAGLADAKGVHTVGHARRTAEQAVRLAEAAGLDDEHVEMVRVAALVHNIGLLAVPARVMTKPDILSVTEMQLMRQHPVHGELVLDALPGFEEIALWVARHHERPDGKGYPEMLSGDEIPLESRIIAIADMYSALISDRPHRGAVSPADARQILCNAAGMQLDPELVNLFASLQ